MALLVHERSGLERYIRMFVEVELEMTVLARTVALQEM